ncbi:type II toxin-antitoxin system PemK/MazF family toxin [Occultella gossypii]|uniref:mRNA interferase n=1 Tax=Occultella gossypii TaxID=2800820 RepID=A0ABS7SDZ5_9MICO|nr:type II toxin-antitoxin system PemK/MazF family toxin [Occultella gossypii]MBZ2198118.1 type II toxin-antitoxin system PemK/MazF family toxin [Occultella gossypii]
MLMPGDVVEIDLGVPIGSEARMVRPAVVVTAARVLRGGPNVVQVVPLTRSIRNIGAEVVIEADDHNGLRAPSAAQCRHVRSIATRRIAARLGRVGPVTLGQIRSTLAILLDL